MEHYSVHGFEIFNLQQFELTLAEIMHDTERYITNMFDELPEYLGKSDKQLLLETKEIYKQQKEILRNVDKRNMLFYVIAKLYSKVTNKVIMLLKLLTDIQKIIYLKETILYPSAI